MCSILFKQYSMIVIFGFGESGLKPDKQAVLLYMHTVNNKWQKTR